MTQKEEEQQQVKDTLYELLGILILRNGGTIVIPDEEIVEFSNFSRQAVSIDCQKARMVLSLVTHEELKRIEQQYTEKPN